MEHRLITGGNEFLPFARSCVAKLKKLGIPYADQSYEVDGASIKVRIQPGHEYIRIDGGGEYGLYLVFSETDSAASAQSIVMSKCFSGVNDSGPINNNDAHHVFGAKAPELTKFKRVPVSVPAVDESGHQRSYSILSFYDAKPVVYMTETWNSDFTAPFEEPTLIPGGNPLNAVDYRFSNGLPEIILAATDTTRRARSLTFGDRTLVSGTWTEESSYYIQQYVSPPHNPGTYTYEATGTQIGISITATNYLGTVLKYEDYLIGGISGANFYGVPKLIGPWASWGLVAADVSSYFVTEVGTEPDPVFTKYDLGKPDKPNGKELLDVSLVPPRVDLTTYRTYLLADIAADPPARPDADPIDRHALDFGYLPYRIEAMQVQVVCKTWAYCWPETAGDNNTGISAVTPVNYKTGAIKFLTAPQLFDPVFATAPGGGYVIPADYSRRHTVFYDDYIVLAKNDPDTAHFWIDVYGTTPGAHTTLPTGDWTDLPLLARITNKPGDLGEGVTQIVVAGLPANSYLIGAFRDELACM